MRASRRLKALARIKGLSFADCVRFFGERNARERRIVELARTRLVHDGELEIDDVAVISEGLDNGSYVMAWAWVDFAGVPGLDKEANSR